MFQTVTDKDDEILGSFISNFREKLKDKEDTLTMYKRIAEPCDTAINLKIKDLEREVEAMRRNLSNFINFSSFATA